MESETPRKSKKPQPRRAGQVKKRGDHKWLISVFLGTDAAGKKLYSAKMVEGTRTEAEKQLRAFQAEKDAGLVVAPSALTLDQHLDKWLDLIKIKIAERTAEDYKQWLAIYIRPELGSKRLSSLKTEDIQAVYKNMLKRKLASRTVRYAHTILSAALKQAVKWGLLASNPATDCTLPRKEQKEMKAMTLEEARRFIEAAKEDPQGIVFLFALETGMRPEEYLGLQWKDLNLEGRTATVQRTLCWRRRDRKSNPDGGWYFGEPKTAKSRRTLPLSDGLVNTLKAHQAASADPEGFVFTASRGGPLISDNLSQRHFKPILKAAGLPKSIRLYDLRHTMATLLLLAGENPKVVSERLGHSSIVLTLDTYSHILPGMQERATQKLEGLLYSFEGDGGG